MQTTQSTHAKKLQPFSKEAQSFQAGDLYEHYKGMQYKIISVARHSETLEELIIYQALDGENEVWSRPLKMFLEKVEVNGVKQPRFKKK